MIGIALMVKGKNMRLIDADELLKIVNENFSGHPSDWVLRKIFEEWHTVDAVPVIRCKDCIYYYPAEYDKKGNTCLLLREMINAPLWVKEDDYCSKGVKE